MNRPLLEDDFRRALAAGARPARGYFWLAGAGCPVGLAYWVTVGPPLEDWAVYTWAEARYGCEESELDALLSGWDRGFVDYDHPSVYLIGQQLRRRYYAAS